MFIISPGAAGRAACKHSSLLAPHNGDGEQATHDDSWVVSTHCDVLGPGRCCQAEDEDEHRHHEQQHRHDYGFPLPPLEGALNTTKQKTKIKRFKSRESMGSKLRDWVEGAAPVWTASESLR